MFNPIKASDNIRKEFISYIETTFSFADTLLKNQFDISLQNIISSGPWLEINDVFKTGLSIDELIEAKVLSPLFKEIEAYKKQKGYKFILPTNRKLYFHQQKAIETIVSGKNAIVSTGTGSGKTNCFLIPVINELLKEKEAGTLGPGIRALFIYPMNALANDQIKNIRKLLMFYPSITFGVYNGGTENEEDDAIRLYNAMFSTEPIPELRKRLQNELLSREEMKENPPNILFTNYAMLEHLLFRPKDNVLFDNSDFKFVVLDEAHIYSGATGIETAILLRRLKARMRSSGNTQFILTSATLGNGETSNKDIIKFAENLCGCVFDENSIIRAVRDKVTFNIESSDYPISLIQELADNQNNISDVLKKYNINIKHEEKATEEELLYDLIKSSNLYKKLRSCNEKVTSITQIQKILGIDEETTADFISICTRAQKNSKALIDARYHFFVRSLEGCYLTLSSPKKLFLSRQTKYIDNNNEEFAVFEVSICDECGKFAIVGKIENNHLVQANKLDDKVSYFYLKEEENNDIDELEEDTDINVVQEINIDNKNKKECYYLCPHCGAIVKEEYIKNKPCDCERKDYIKIVKARQLKSGVKCGNCKRGNYKRLYLGNDAATSVLATSLYEELPEITYENNEIETPKTNNFFGQFSIASKKKSKKTGRQFLVFSDSRQEAAKFACYLSKSYNEFLRRRGIYQIILEQKDNLIKKPENISSFVSRLTSYFSNKRSFASSNNDNSNLSSISNKNAWVAMLNELARYNSPTSLTSLGILQFEFAGNCSDIINDVAKNTNTNYDSIKNLLNFLIFEIVKKGAIVPDNDSDIDDNDREYIFYTPSQKFVTKIQDNDNKKKTIFEWSPKIKKGKINEYTKTIRLDITKKILKFNDENAANFLDQYFDYLTANEYLIDKNKDNTYVLKASDFKVRINGDQTIKWYKCKKCGKISQFNINGLCSIPKCDGKVEEVNPKELGKNNHFAELYFSDRMAPLFIKEHTAQLSKKEGAEYQEQFVKKEINALSCSTTFEMGVDVGDLETVFLRDVPPLPSNYAQRAGRAGRSINAAAYALTFAKLSSHDLSFFKEPKKMINGSIMPPLFKVDNEKIVKRHIYAIAFSMFFSENSEQYYHNDAEKFINEEGYIKFFEWLDSKPERLKDMIKRSIPDINNLHDRIGINDYTWLEDFNGDQGVFTSLIKEYKANIEEFKKLIKNYKKEEDFDKANQCQNRLNFYKHNKLIDFLARGNILPRYGFPVDTVELEQNTTATNISKLRLSRDLQVAIAEYAPSSEIIADGKLYTSRYIKKSIINANKQGWHTGYIGICSNENCQAINYSITPIEKEGIQCLSCGEIIPKQNFFESIEPRAGFATEREAKEVPLTQQEKNYRSDDFYIGNKEAKLIEKYHFIFKDEGINIESTTNDSLLVKSSNSFYVCPKCGFAYASDENITGDKEATEKMKSGAHKITTIKKHESYYGKYNCTCTELKKYTMHHTFNTDVAKIDFECDTSDRKTMLSTMYALLFAMADELNIERRDIKACLSHKLINSNIHYSIIIYDSVPGGAGHSRRLVTKDGKMFYQILKKAYYNMTNCSCNPSCYNCLRSYENQKIHDQLDRNLAIKFISKFLDE